MDKIKLKLILTEDNELPCAGLRDARKLSRKYRALKIENSLDFHSFVDQKAVVVMQTIGSQLLYLELKNFTFSVDNILLVKTCFESMPQLEDLKADGAFLK